MEPVMIFFEVSVVDRGDCYFCIGGSYDSEIRDGGVK